MDDDADYRAYIAAMTRRIGFVVDVAPDGQAALEAAADGTFDAAVIDHEMPRLNGIDVIARLRASDRTRGIYAVMLSAHEELDTKISALTAGFDDFIAKSSAETEIMARLSSAHRVAARQRTMDVTIRELYGLATCDELTGLFNRRFFTSEVERMLDERVPLSVIMFDVDGFKQLNDTYGHLAGDHALRDIGALFHRNTRPEDIVARLGGDEFAMAIPHLEVHDIEKFAQRLASDVESLSWTFDGASFRLGISTGIASTRLLPKPTLAGLLDVADRDMYKNKWLRKHPAPQSRVVMRPAAGELPEKRSSP